MYLRRGYSLNKINQSLRHKGVDSKYIKQSIDKIKEDRKKIILRAAQDFIKQNTT